MKINQTSVRRINWMWTLDGFEQFCQELPGSSSGLFISHHRFEKWIVINFLSKCQDALKDAQRILWHNVYNTSFSTLEQLFLCEQEIDQLCEEWTPEPLHPPITEEMEKEPPVLERWELLIVLNLTQNCGLRRMNKRSTCATFQNDKNGFPCTCFGLLSLSFLSQPSFVIWMIFCRCNMA